MKQKLFTLLLTVAASVGTMFAQVTIDGLNYNLNNELRTAEVATNSSVSGDIIIPSSVTYNSKTYSVTSIGYGAFYYCSSLTSVTISNSVTSIGDYAFYQCSGLTTVTIGNSVTSIGNQTFYNCTNLTSVTIPNSVTSIGEGAFSYCSGLTSVTIGNSVTSIERWAFEQCSSLTSLTIGNSVTSIGEAAFYNCSSLTSVTIPNSVTIIGGGAFGNCSGLTSVHISDIAAWCAISFGNHDANPLYYAHNLYLNDELITNLVIPDNVTSIGNDAFYNCSSLTSVTIGNSVTSIGNNTFEDCSGLTSITCEASTPPTLGSNVFSFVDKSIPLYVPTGSVEAYQTADQWKDFTNILPIGETPAPTIYTVTFKDWDGTVLKTEQVEDGHSATAPANPTREGYTFSGWDKEYNNVQSELILTAQYTQNSITPDPDSEVAGPPSNEIWYTSSDGNIVMPYDTYDLPTIVSNTYSNGKGIIKFASDVTSIGFEAFQCCTGLTSVTIPNSVTSIESWAFGSCYGLTSVTIPNSVTSIAYYAFEHCYSLTDIYATTCGDLERIKMLVSGEYQDKVKYVPLPYIITINATNGNVTYPQTMCVDMSLNATPEYGYHFVQWSDGLKDNPRVIELTQDTTFTAEFAKNSYSISTISANPEWGTAAGDTTALYLDEVEISAIPNYGYHFVRWNDNNTSNPRIVSVTEDKTFTATFAKNVYSITTNAEHGYIYGNSSAEYLDFVTLTVTADYGYHFTQWSDGMKDNPRIAQITQDTTFTAEFVKNTYTISTTSANPEWGTTAGDTAALYLDEVEISAIPNYGYHFERWNDYNTSNPRTVSVTQDKTYTATFAKNVYSITKNAEHGTISGNSSAEYLDLVTLTVTPDYGYHFTQWSDGLKDNPRIFQITSDTTFTAEFAPDRVGTCGKDLALVWSYDPTNKVLTIGNAGSFTENMQFGAEAPNEMEELVIGNSVTAIGANAFAGIETLKKVSIGESVKTIGEQAFYNCVNLETIFNYRPTPTNTYSNAFDGVDKFECVLYVLPNSIDMYKAAAVWRDFYYTYAIGAEEATMTTNDVTVEPQDNAATLTWPTSNNAASYTIQITKDGVVFCTLIFNSNGQLTGIAFAPSRDGQAHAPQAIMTANGLQFTVTGLDSNTQYGYSVTAKDANDQPVATYSGEFTTTSEGEATGFEDVSSSLQGGDRGRLILSDGQIFILRGEKVYTIAGQEVR